MEAQFRLREVRSDIMKYFHVVAMMDASATARVIELLHELSASTIHFSHSLLNILDCPNWRRQKYCCPSTGRGTSKQSNLMERILAVLYSADPSFMFTYIFLCQLPVPVSTALSISCLSSKNYHVLAWEAGFPGQIPCADSQPGHSHHAALV